MVGVVRAVRARSTVGGEGAGRGEGGEGAGEGAGGGQGGEGTGGRGHALAAFKYS